MDLHITGKVIKILEEQSGKGKNGPWRKRDFILETEGEYPRKVCITQWGDQIDKNSVKKDETVTAFIDIQSREYKGNWYTDVKAWKIETGAPAKSEGTTDEVVIDFGTDSDDEAAPF